MPPEPAELAIDALGDGGDGIATLAGRRIHVPWTLPGERVQVRETGGGRAEPLFWLQRSAERADPACVHFGSCGGCAVQHLGADAYRRWKHGLAAAAARRAGFPDVVPEPLVESPPGSRRRVTLAAVRAGTRVALGFHAPASRDIVDLQACPVMLPQLLDLLPALRAALAEALTPAQRCDIALTATNAGIDALVTGTMPRARLAPLARLGDLARLCLAEAAGRDPELVALHRAPAIDFDGIVVEPPPGVFLQATRAGETAIRDAVDDGLGSARRVADLFSGCGTLALPMARRRQVLAVDSQRAAIEALDRAARAGGVAPRVTVAVRDLERRPLVAEELGGFDAVVFDPPREGARAQAEALARSAVARVVAVSCNPATFARDAAALGAGGYRLERLTPIDQFLWSPHLELVGVFVRPRAARAPRNP